MTIELVVVHKQNIDKTWDSLVPGTRVCSFKSDSIEQAMYFTRVLLEEEYKDTVFIKSELFHYVTPTMP